MTPSLPKYYFRARDNGAAVFKVDSENRQRRIEMEQIALVNIRNGEIKPHGDRKLTNADIGAIRDWMEDRIQRLAWRDIDDILRTADHLNLTTQWVQSKATPEQSWHLAMTTPHAKGESLHSHTNRDDTML